ncbi:FAD-dependent monooxygenase [Actinosynnema sp. NPDC053489]|uniref:FAD-dependent monooxygenase n=1 Tax=Actinosynnema sp. NPDC053489 TaxID=3363916 RepID=UPI0037CA2C1A
MTMGDTSSPPVLVIGAGPVGIVLACELLQQGVPVRVVDRTASVDETDPHSKGILIWPRSLELLRRIGVSDRLVELGHKVPGVGYYSGRRLLGTAHIHRLRGSSDPYVLTLPQRYTERVLRARLAELGGVVERGVELVALDNSGEHPVAVLRHPDGTRETVTPRYLVGADGPASTTRNLLGIGFAGEAIDITYVIGDAPLHGPVPRDTAQYYYSRTGVVALVPLRSGVFRVAANIPHRAEDAGDPPRELLEQVINERAVRGVRVGEPDWTRSFRPRLGMADSMQQGRCFLAGDSAHAISPAGGQGMNVGFQDAVNLAWKLGGVLNGRLAESVLMTYGAERLAGAHRMSRTSAAQARFAMQRKPLRIARRDALFLAARASGLLTRVLVPLLSQTDNDYGGAEPVPLPLRNLKPARVGERVPLFAHAEPVDDPAALDRDRHTVVVWPGRGVPANWAAAVAGVRAAVGDRLPVSDFAAVPRTPALRKAFGRCPVVAVVRPDGHLSHLGDPTDLDGLRAHLARLMPEPRPTLPVPAPDMPVRVLRPAAGG